MVVVVDVVEGAVVVVVGKGLLDFNGIFGVFLVAGMEVVEGTSVVVVIIVGRRDCTGFAGLFLISSMTVGIVDFSVVDIVGLRDFNGILGIFPD